MKLSSDDLSLLIDALEASSHLDTTTEEENHRDDLSRRLLQAFDNCNDRQFSLF